MPFALTDVLRAMKGGVPTLLQGLQRRRLSCRRRSHPNHRPGHHGAIRGSRNYVPGPDDHGAVGMVRSHRRRGSSRESGKRAALGKPRRDLFRTPPASPAQRSGPAFRGPGPHPRLDGSRGECAIHFHGSLRCRRHCHGSYVAGRQSKRRSELAAEPRSTDMIPVMALIDVPQDTTPGQNAFPVPSGFAGGILQLLFQLADWFAPNLETEPTSPMLGARYRLNSRMEPLVDGIPTYKRLLEDLAFTKGTNGSASFGGWKFTAFPIQQETPRTSLLELSQDIVAAGGKVHILASQFLQATDATLDSLGQEAGLYMLIFYSLGTAATAVTITQLHQLSWTRGLDGHRGRSRRSVRGEARRWGQYGKGSAQARGGNRSRLFPVAPSRGDDRAVVAPSCDISRQSAFGRSSFTRRPQARRHSESLWRLSRKDSAGEIRGRHRPRKPMRRLCWRDRH